MSIVVNAVLQSGTVKWPGLRYDGNGRPEFRFVLYRETANAEGQTFPLSIPCCSPGATGGTSGHRTGRRREAIQTLKGQLIAADRTLRLPPTGSETAHARSKLILWSKMVRGTLKEMGQDVVTTDAQT